MPRRSVAHWLNLAFEVYPISRGGDGQGGGGRGYPNDPDRTIRGRRFNTSLRDAQKAGRETSDGLYTIYTMPDEVLNNNDRLVDPEGLRYTVIHRQRPSEPWYSKYIAEVMEPGP